MSPKITARHLERLAIVYVRQSSLQQVAHHQESTRLQYGLTEHAGALGWPSERVLVIDEDLGRSGASSEGRPGFQRLVAEVGLDHVGMILGIEMSRLARSCRDWHQLLEICALFGTLIGDVDGIYDPSHYNDRLLLGLKGTMSEAELHVLRQRLLQGKLNKARRGEVVQPLPVGYLRRPSGEVVKDVDEQARAVVELVFEQFEAVGTLHGLLRYLEAHDIKLPVRLKKGANKGELAWRRPNRSTLSHMLHNPIYAGAYAFGRTRKDARRYQHGRPGTGRHRLSDRADWQVLLHDRLPAYISWTRYEANVQQLAANKPSVMGVARRGAALLSGLVVCGRCSHRMLVSYTQGQHRYGCVAEGITYGGKRCISFAGGVLEEHVTQMVFRALEPSALEVSLRVAEDIEAERRRLEQSWRQRLERAQFDVDRAMRQYDAVEPENRLVARTLERQLEEKLAEHRKLQEQHRRWLAEAPATLTTDEREAIAALARDIPALWHAPTTTHQDRQMIVRQLIDRVVVDVKGHSEQMTVVVHWAGGHRTTSALRRPVWRIDQLSYHRQLIERIAELRSQGLRWESVADRLNQEHWRPPRRNAGFGAINLRKLAEHHGLTKTRDASELRKLATHEWTLPALAKELNMPPVTLLAWIGRGWVRARRLGGKKQPWALWADAKELARLRALRTASNARWSCAPMAVA